MLQYDLLSEILRNITTLILNKLELLQIRPKKERQITHHSSCLFLMIIMSTINTANFGSGVVFTGKWP